MALFKDIQSMTSIGQGLVARPTVMMMQRKKPIMLMSMMMKKKKKLPKRKVGGDMLRKTKK